MQFCIDMTLYKNLFLDESKVPVLYAQANKSKENVEVYSVVFSPALKDWFWCVTEKDPDSGLCFGFVNGDFAEFGYFDLDEMLESGIEFRMHPKWKPGMTMSEIQDAFKKELHDH